jgi:hypothetical protein
MRRFLLVTLCIAACHRESVRCGVHGRITDGVRGARTVSDTVGVPRTATDGPRWRRVAARREEGSRVHLCLAGSAVRAVSRDEDG